MNDTPCFVNIQEAKNHFSQLLARAHSGEDIIICEAGKPYVRLTAIEQPQRRELGFLKDLFSDEELDTLNRALMKPMDEEELSLWYGPSPVATLHLAENDLTSEDS